MIAVRAPPPSSSSFSSRAQPQLRTAHLLPCRIHHDGPVCTSRRYWDPKLGHDGKPEAYFRGRRLKGRSVPVPERYRGVVVREGEEGEERIEGGGAVGGRREGGGGMEEGDEGMEEDEEEEEEEVKVLDEVARFEELVVWGHESVPEEDNVFVKGVEEWIKFAEAIHANGNSEPIPPPPDESRK